MSATFAYSVRLLAMFLLVVGFALGASAPTQPTVPVAEITALKPLYPETMLARAGAPAALVLWGDHDDLAALGRETAATLSKKTGAAIEALPANDLVSQWWEIGFARLAGRNVIAIGNINNNRLLAALWGEGYTAEDAMFPGAGGYVVRTVHDPFARKFNVIVLAGSDVAGTRRAVEAFLAKHLVTRDGSTLVPQPVVEVVRGAALPPYVVRPGKTPPAAAESRTKIRSAAEFAADLDKLVAQERSRTDNPDELGVRTLVNVTGTLATLAEAWFKTGDPGLPPLMKRLVDRHRDLLKTAPRRVEMEGASADHMIWWNIVEALPLWTAQDRLDLTNAFLRDARQGFEHQRPYDLVKEGFVQVVGENHGTFSAMHLLDAWSYFEKYYALPDTAYWMSIVRATFAGQIASHQILEDSSGYLIGCPMHNVMYAFKTRDMRYFQLGIARHHLDYMLQAVHNNLGLLTGFGDSPNLLPWNHAVFGRMAWFLRDPHAQWWMRDFLPNDCGVATYETDTPWDFDRPVAPPADWDGVKVFPLYRQALGFETDSKTVVTSPPESAGPEWFNKIVFREGVGADRQFLLLDGAAVWRSTPGVEKYPPGPAGHNHHDINTIITFTDRSRIWLVDSTYEQRGIADHNGLVITRDGQFRYVPHQARLRDLAQSSRLGLVRTLYEDYSDADWERTIFWLRGDYFVVLDRVIARKTGDFAARSNLRALGEDQLDGAGLWLEQKGKWGRIIPDAAAQTEVVPVPFKDAASWRPYPFARPVAKSLLQFKSAHLAAGEAMSFASVVAAGDSREELAGLRLETLAGTGARVGAGESAAVYGVGSPSGVAAAMAAHAILDRDALLAGVSLLGSADAPVLLARPSVQLIVEGDRVWIDATEPTQLDLPQETVQRTQQLPAGRHELTVGSVRAFAQTLTGLATKPSAPSTTVATAQSSTTPLPALSTTFRRVAPDAQRLLVTDLDGDGQDEWLVAGAKGLTAQRPTGETLWTFPTSAACRTLAAADLDGDGKREIALGCDDEHLYLIGEDGRERWRFRLKASDRTARPTADLVQIADIDRDGTPEILVIGNWIHCLDASGKVKWERFQKFARNRHEGDTQAFAVVHRDGSDQAEIFVAYLNNYSAVIGYDGQGQRTFPADIKRAKHGGIGVAPPQAVALADMLGDGGRLELVIATKNDLTIRQTDAAHEWSPNFSESGNFTAVTTWAPASAPATVFGATDMGAVFAFQATRDSQDSGQKIGRRWVRSVGAKIHTLAVLPAGSPDATLWVGTTDGAIIQLDPATGAPRAATKPTGSAVRQFIETRTGLHALHADGIVETIGATAPAGPVAAVTISNVRVGSFSTKSAIIRWDTDVAAAGQVGYGTSTAYDGTMPESEPSKDHYVFLDNLTPGTNYHYQVRSGGAVAADGTFTTAAKVEDLWPVVSLSFDDGGISHFTTAFPLLKARNMRGAVNVITDRLAKPGNGNMSVAQLLFLQQQGWEVDSHSRAHNRDRTLTDEDEVVGSVAYLESHGISKVSSYRVPGSNHSQAREALAARTYPLRWGNVIGGPPSPRYTTLPLAPGIYAGVPLDFRQSATAGERVAKYQAAVDELLARHQYTHFIFHAIVDTTPDGYHYPPAELAALLDYLQAKGIKVIPPGELLRSPSSPELQRD